MSSQFQTDHVRKLAYDRTKGAGPGVVFLGGFRSDKEGTKALYLEDWAHRRKHAFLKFDYSGHGASGGVFEDGSIGDWMDDAIAIIEGLTKGPQVLVGSSMGGWISLLIARDRPDLVSGLVTIAAAPDFTESMRAAFDEDQLATLESAGQVELPSDYSDEPYVITKRLIDDGQARLVLEDELDLQIPTRFLQGTDDADVDVSVAHRLLDHATAPDMRLTLVKGADHRFSEPECLTLLARSVEDVVARAGG